MDLGKLADKERRSKKYAEEFFEEEWEMEGIFKTDLDVLNQLIKKKGKILDITMGPGRHVKYFADKGFKVWGNDFSKHMINVAKKYVKNSSVVYTNHDMRSLSHKDNLFDNVICMGASLGSIYRSKERQRAVNEMARVTKKGGRVFIHAHNLLEISEFEDFRNLLNLIYKSMWYPKQYELGDVVYYHSRVLGKAYMHWFTPRELRNLMKKAGLKIVDEFYLQGPDQDSIMPNSLLKHIKAGGFIFVGKKRE